MIKKNDGISKEEQRKLISYALNFNALRYIKKKDKKLYAAMKAIEKLKEEREEKEC